MTKAEYFDFFVKFTDQMRVLTKLKNDDYSAGVDPFANFTSVEALRICTAEQGFLTRMTDKLSRLSSFVQRGELSIKEESVTDTAMDLAVYSVLFAAFIASKKPLPPASAPLQSVATNVAQIRAP